MGDPVEPCPVRELDGAPLEGDQAQAPPLHEYLVCRLARGSGEIGEVALRDLDCAVGAGKLVVKQKKATRKPAIQREQRVVFHRVAHPAHTFAEYLGNRNGQFRAEPRRGKKRAAPYWLEGRGLERHSGRGPNLVVDHADLAKAISGADQIERYLAARLRNNRNLDASLHHHIHGPARIAALEEPLTLLEIERQGRSQDELACLIRDAAEKPGHRHCPVG
jgi:hypothetical protein